MVGGKNIMTVRSPHYIRLDPKEKLALRTFNKEVIFLRGVSQNLQTARVNALYNFKGRDVSITDLAGAFRSLYPHWFTNGRGTLAEGTAADCAKVCLDVIGKLNTSTGQHFGDMTRLFDLSGDGGAMPTGRRPLAHTDKGQGHKRTRTRTRRIHCKYHSDKAVVARDLCAQCYNRMNSLGKKEMFVELLPKQAMEEIMLSPRPSRSRPLYRTAQLIIKKYEKLEEI